MCTGGCGERISQNMLLVAVLVALLMVCLGGQYHRNKSNPKIEKEEIWEGKIRFRPRD